MGKGCDVCFSQDQNSTSPLLTKAIKCWSVFNFPWVVQDWHFALLFHPGNLGNQSFLTFASKTANLPLPAWRLQRGFCVLKPPLVLQGTRDPYILREHPGWKACVLAIFMHNWSAFMRKVAEREPGPKCDPSLFPLLKGFPRKERLSFCWKWSKWTPHWNGE